MRVRVCASRVSRAPDVLWGGSFPWPDGESDSNQSDQGNEQHQHPRATDGGNKDDPAHHWAAILALCSPHCQVGIGLQRPLPHDDQDLPLCLAVAVAVASTSVPGSRLPVFGGVVRPVQLRVALQLWVRLLQALEHVLVLRHHAARHEGVGMESERRPGWWRLPPFFVGVCSTSTISHRAAVWH